MVERVFDEGEAQARLHPRREVTAHLRDVDELPLDAEVHQQDDGQEEVWYGLSNGSDSGQHVIQGRVPLVCHEHAKQYAECEAEDQTDADAEERPGQELEDDLADGCPARDERAPEVALETWGEESRCEFERRWGW